MTPKSNSTPRSQPSWKTRLLAVAMSVLVALVVAELGLRIAAIDMAAPWVPDQHCGWRLLASHRFRQYSEGSSLIVTNSDGHRDRQHTKAKPPGVIRIAVLGDSYAEALQVDLHETFWSVMERELSTCAALDGRKIEVLNFGIAGYGTTQELQMLRHYVWEYEPDIVLVAFLAANDVRNNSRQLETEDLRRPFYDLVDGQLKLDLSFREQMQRQSNWLKLKIALVRHVRLCSLAYRLKENWKQGRSQSVPDASDAPAELGLDNFALVPPKDATWANAWAITEAVFAELSRDVTSHGARLIAVAINTSIQIDADSDAARALRRQFDVDDLDEADRKLTEIGSTHGFSVVLLTPRMRTQFQREGNHFHGFRNTGPGQGHWNAAGHRVAAELLAHDLCEMKALWTDATSENTP